MKITIEHYGTKHSIETDHDDVSFEKFMELLESLTKGIYSAELWNEYFIDQ